MQIIAETLGTYFLIFAGCAAVVVNADKDKVVTLPGISIVWGLVVMVMVYSVGHISGAHFNPAVTIAFATCKRFPWKQVPLSTYSHHQITNLLLNYCIPKICHSKDESSSLITPKMTHTYIIAARARTHTHTYIACQSESKICIQIHGSVFTCCTLNLHDKQISENSHLFLKLIRQNSKLLKTIYAFKWIFRQGGVCVCGFFPFLLFLKVKPNVSKETWPWASMDQLTILLLLALNSNLQRFI